MTIERVVARLQENSAKQSGLQGKQKVFLKKIQQLFPEHSVFGDDEFYVVVRGEKDKSRPFPGAAKIKSAVRKVAKELGVEVEYSADDSDPRYELVWIARDE